MEKLLSSLSPRSNEAAAPHPDAAAAGGAPISNFSPPISNSNGEAVLRTKFIMSSRVQ